MPKHLYALGDIHGEFGEINKSILRLKKYWQNNFTLIGAGDIGLGFPAMEKHHGIWINVAGENNDPKSFPDNFKFFAGNHDSRAACKKYPNYLGDFGYNEELNIFYISGGFSIDRDTRQENVDWWADEELSINQLNKCVDYYDIVKPSFVISHECPMQVQKEMHKEIRGYSRTSQALQSMFEIWQPDLWIFGHHHLVWSKQIGKTKFTCASINQTVKIY